MRKLIFAGMLALMTQPALASASAEPASHAPPGVLTMDCTKQGPNKTYKYRLSIDLASGEFSKSNPNFNVHHHLVEYDDRWVVLGRQVGSEQLPDRTVTYDWTEVLNRRTGELKTDGYVGPVDMTSRAQCEEARN